MAKRTTIPPMPFDTQDWLSSPALKALSPEVRGLWLDMICYMWESAERGVLLKPNQVPYSREEIKRIVGVDSTGTDGWIDQLLDRGFVSIREDGAFYCRKMVRSEEIREKRRKAGKKGGDVTRAKVLLVPKPEVPKVPDQKPEPTAAPVEEASKKKKKKVEPEKISFAEFVTLTQDEYDKLVAKFGETGTRRMIEILDNYKGSKGAKYKCDYRAILNWVVERYNDERLKYGNKNIGGATEPPNPTGEPHYQDTL